MTRRASTSRWNNPCGTSSSVERPTAWSGHPRQDLLHLGGRESTQRLSADVAQQVRRQQDAGGRLVVRGVEDAHLVVVAQRPVHLLDTHSHRLDLGGPVGHPLGRLLSGLDALAKIFAISEAVKARNVCVRMLPSRSAASKTLAAVSSSGASKTHTWS